MRTIISLALLAALGSSCASAAHDPRAELAHLLSERADLELRRIPPDDGASLALVDGLLEDGLGEEEAVRVALLASRRLQALLAGLDVARGELVAAVAGANPHLEVEAIVPDGGSWQLELTLVQEVLDLLRRPARARIAAEELRGRVLRVADEVLALVTRARLAHLDVQGAARAVELRREALEVAATAHELALRLREAGNVTELALLLEQAAHEDARLELAAAERGLAAAREELNAVLGLWGERTGWSLAQGLAEPGPPPAEPAAIEARAVAASFELAARRHGIEAAAARAGLDRNSAWLAELELGAKGEREGGEWELGPVLALPLPIFDRGRGRRLRSAGALQRESEMLRARAVELRAAARSRAAELGALWEEARHLRRVLVPLREAIAAQTLLQYNAMQVDAFELLAARRASVHAALRLVESELAYGRARIAIEALLAGAAPPEVGSGANGLFVTNTGTGSPGDHR